MATMSISMPEPMRRWVEDEAAAGGHGDPGEVVRDLIRREQERKGKIAEMQRLVDEALAQPTIEMTTDEIMAGVRDRARMRRRDAA